MDGGSIIRSPCTTAGVDGASRAPLPPATAGSRQILSAPLRAAVPSASRPPIYASSKAVSSGSGSTPCLCDKDPSLSKEEEEETEKKEETRMGFSALKIFGPAPSRDEAEEAISTLQMISFPTNISQFVGDEANSFTGDAFDQAPLLDEKVNRASSSSLDQSKPELQVYRSSSVLSQFPHKVLNALHLLRVNPSVQSMVVSLSTDKAVWNAIMKNKMVQELKKSYHADKYLKYVEYASRGSTTRCSDECPGITAQILSWVFGIAKAIVMQFIDDIISLVHKLFDLQGKDAIMDNVRDLVRYSFVLCVLVFIIVILKRSMSSSA